MVICELRAALQGSLSADWPSRSIPLHNSWRLYCYIYMTGDTLVLLSAAPDQRSIAHTGSHFEYRPKSLHSRSFPLQVSICNDHIRVCLKYVPELSVSLINSMRDTLLDTYSSCREQLISNPPVMHCHLYHRIVKMIPQNQIAVEIILYRYSEYMQTRYK